MPDNFEQFIADVEPLFYRRFVTYVDVGAYDGSVFRKLMDSRIDIGDAHLIEPNPTSFAELRTNVADIAEGHAVHLYDVAAGDEATRVTMKAARTMTQVMKPETAAAALAADIDSTFTVSSVTLDSMQSLFRDNHVGLLKVDVEGFEDRVLKGAAGMLAARKIDIIYIEAGANPNSSQQCYYRTIEDILQSHDYRLFKIYEQKNEWVEDSAVLRRMNMAFLSPTFAESRPLRLFQDLFAGQEKIKDLKDRVERAGERSNTLRERITVLEETSDASSKEVKRLEKLVAARDASVLGLTEALQKAQAETTDLKTQFDAARSAQERLSGQVEENRTSATRLDRRFNEANAEIARLNAQIEKVRSQTRAEAAEKALLSDQLDAARVEAAHLNGGIDYARAEAERLSGRLDSAKAQVVRSTAQLDAARSEIGVLTGARDSAAEEAERINRELDLARQEVVRLTSRMEDAAAEIVSLNGQLETSRDELAAVTGERDETQEEATRLTSLIDDARADEQRALDQLEDSRGEVENLSQAVQEGEARALEAVAELEVARAAMRYQERQIAGGVADREEVFNRMTSELDALRSQADARIVALQGQVEEGFVAITRASETAARLEQEVVERQAAHLAELGYHDRELAELKKEATKQQAEIVRRDHKLAGMKKETARQLAEIKAAAAIAAKERRQIERLKEQIASEQAKALADAEAAAKREAALDRRYAKAAEDLAAIRSSEAWRWTTRVRKFRRTLAGKTASPPLAAQVVQPRPTRLAAPASAALPAPAQALPAPTSAAPKPAAAKSIPPSAAMIPAVAETAVIDVRSIENRLWGGFSHEALAELERVERTAEAGGATHRAAALAIATWHAAEGRFDEAYRHLAVYRPADPDKTLPLPVVLLEAYCLAQTGRGAEARPIIEAAREAAPKNPDLMLAMANTFVHADQSEVAADAEQRLEWINRVYDLAGLARIGRIDANRPLVAGNITTIDAKPVPADGQPKVSVIIPAFAGEKTLGFTVEGLVNQTWRNLEIIIVDDLSTDGTRSVAEALAGTDPRINVILQDVNQGSYSARNRGLQAATGDYITIHDTGDWSHAQKIERQVRHLMNNPGSVGNHSKWVRCYDNLMFVGKFRRKDKIIDWNPSSLMFRREVFDLVGGWDRVRISADAEFFRRVKKAAAPLEVGPVPDVAPMSLGFDTPFSLTKRAETHGRTITHGFRREYHEAANHWHATAPLSALKIDIRPDAPRAFPAPAAIHARRPDAKPFDLLVVAPFNELSAESVVTRLRSAVDAGRSVALLNWRIYGSDPTQPLPSAVRQLAQDGKVSIVAPGEKVRATTGVLHTPAVTRNLIDLMPQVALDTLLVIDAKAGADVTQQTLARLDALLSSKGEWLPEDKVWARVLPSGKAATAKPAAKAGVAKTASKASSPQKASPAKTTVAGTSSGKSPAGKVASVKASTGKASSKDKPEKSKSKASASSKPAPTSSAKTTSAKPKKPARATA